MPNIKVVQIDSNNVVFSESIVGHGVDRAGVIEVDINGPSLMGMVYDETTDTFKNPPAPEPKPEPGPNTKLSRLKFEMRFTDEEWIAIDLASFGETTEAAMVRRFLRRIDQANYIDLSDPKLIEGMNQLSTLVPEVTSERVTEILETPVTEDEAYR